jgi:hypothetical protein
LNRSVSLAEGLAPELRVELQAEVDGVGRVTDSFVDALNARLQVTERYDVSLGRLRYYLRNLGKSSARVGDESASGLRACAASDVGEPTALREHRLRQRSVAAILEATFGPHADSNPDLWERRAYLMLVGMVYERLSCREADLETDELVRLAKVLAENRRVDVRARQTGATEECSEAAAHNGRLPDRFGDVVRQVYGTNFQMPSSETAREAGAD